MQRLYFTCLLPRECAEAKGAEGEMGRKLCKTKREQEQPARSAVLQKRARAFPSWLSRSNERSPIKMLSSGKRRRGMRLVNIIKTTPHKNFMALHFCTFYSQHGEKKRQQFLRLDSRQELFLAFCSSK